MIIWDIAFSADGSLFLSGNAYGLHIWNAANGELITINPGFTPVSTCGCITVTADQYLVMIDSENSLVSLWGIRSGQ